jgi:hypothetical protein
MVKTYQQNQNGISKGNLMKTQEAFK